MLRGPDAFHQVAAALRDGVTAQLDPVPDRAGVVPGAIAWDACDCGQFAVALTATWVSNSPPAELPGDRGEEPCGAAFLGATYAIQVARCAPTIDDAGNPPPVEAEEEAAELLAADAYAVRMGVRCALGPLRRAQEIAGWLSGALSVQGPEGGCVGVELTVRAWVLNDCPDCEG